MKRSKTLKSVAIPLLVFTSAFLIMSFQNCSMVAPTHEFRGLSSSTSISSYTSVPTFAELNQKIIVPKCMACHSSGLSNYSSYSALMASGSVVPGNLAGSTFYQQILAGTMPLGRAPLDASDTAAVAAWVQAGATENGVAAVNPTPSAITNLAGNAVSQTSINLSWTLPAGNLLSVTVERGSSGAGPFTVVATLAGTAKSYIDSGLTASLSYSYRLKSANSNGDSPYSAVVSVSTSSYPPANPGGLMAAAISQSQINLSWMDNSSDETGFVIERASAVGGPFTVIITTLSNEATFSDMGLTASTAYYYRVAAINAAGKSSYTSTVSAMTSAPAPTIPAAPSAIMASATSSSQISLTWMDNSSDETGFVIERALAVGGPFSVISTTTSNVKTFSDMGLTASTTYYYRLAANNTAGKSSYASTVSAMTNAPVPTIPLAPSSVVASATSSSQISLTWMDNSSDETGFVIERSSAVGGPFSVISTTTSNVKTFSNVGLPASTAYYYRVAAVNTAGKSSYTSTVSATTSAPAATVPTAPSAVMAATISQSQINLSWMDNSIDETGFVIERALAVGGPFSAIITTTSNIKTFSDMGLTPSTAYYYRLAAINAAGKSSYTSTVSATTSAPVPIAPSAVMAAAISQSQINLSWADNSIDETGFVIERSSAAGGPFNAITTTTSNVKTFSDMGLTASTVYYYRVAAINAAGKSSYTSTVSATTNAPAPTIPLAPSSVVASATSSSQISLSWADNSIDETGFVIERALAVGGPFSVVTTTTSNVKTFSDMGLAASTAYYYRVAAINAAGKSSYTSTVSATTNAPAPTIPVAPSAVMAVATSSSQVSLTWADNSTNETGFKIERATAAAGPFTLVNTVGSGVTSYSDGGLATVSTYYYQVSSTNPSGSSVSPTSAGVTTFGTFTWVKANISTPKCLNCHSSANPSAGIDLSTYAGTMKTVVVGNPGASTYYSSTLSGSMPVGGTKLTTAQLNALKTWINSGAPNN